MGIVLRNSPSPPNQEPLNQHMTRKDYTLLASALAKSRPLIPRWDAQHRNTQQAAFQTWHETRECIMEVLQANNPAFNRERFIAATEADPS